MNERGEFIWVIAHDGGCEGWSLPVQAFNNEADAWSVLATINAASSETMRVAKVALWPTPPLGEWFRLEPSAKPESEI